MKIKPIFLIIGIIGVLIVVGIACYIIFDSINNYRKFTSSMGGTVYNFKADKSWQEISDIDKTKLKEEKKYFPSNLEISYINNEITSQDEKPIFGLNILNMSGKNNLNVADSKKNIIDTLKENVIGYKEIESKEISVDESQGFILKYEFFEITGINMDKKYYIQEQVLYLKNEKLVTLVFTAPRDEFDNLNKEWDKIIKYFKIVE